VAGIGVVSAADEIEPDVMEVLQNRSRKGSPSAVLKGRPAGNERLPSGIPFRGWRCAKQSALQKPEFLKLCLAPGDHPAGRIQVDVFVQQFELAERSGCWSRLAIGAFRHGSLSVAEKSHLAGKATTFFFARKFSGGDS
jgi:hypothetical protein